MHVSANRKTPIRPVLTGLLVGAYLLTIMPGVVSAACATVSLAAEACGSACCQGIAASCCSTGTADDSASPAAYENVDGTAQIQGASQTCGVSPSSFYIAEQTKRRVAMAAVQNAVHGAHEANVDPTLWASILRRGPPLA